MNYLGLLIVVITLAAISACILVYACLCVSSECSRREEKREEAHRGRLET